MYKNMIFYTLFLCIFLFYPLVCNGQTSTTQIVTTPTQTTTVTPPITPPTITTPTITPSTTPLPNGCPPEGVGKIPHERNCSLYYICVNGVEYEQECADDLHFNPVLKECDFPGNVNCTTLPECPPEGVSFHPIPGNCSLYVICAEGTPIIQTCAPGTCFDPEELKCREIHNNSVSYNVPKQVMEIGKNLEDRNNWISKCKTNVHGIVLVPGDKTCEKFSVCRDGDYKATFRCQDGICFDAVAQNCNFSQKK